MTAIFGGHMTHITSVRNGGRFLAYKVSKYEQNQLRFKEFMAAKTRISPPKDKYWILISTLKVKS